MIETPVTERKRKRWAWLAIVLSVVTPGVGHVYCGNLRRGLVFGLLCGLGIPVVLGLLAYWRPTSTIAFGLLMVLATFGVVIVAAVDAYRLARRTQPDYALKAYNRLAIYVLIALLVEGSSIGYALHVRASLFEAFRVTAASEYPTIVPQDRILANKIAYRASDPQRGDVVLFHPPTDNWRIHYIKRIVALAGDTVHMRDGELYVNGRKLPRTVVARHAAGVGVGERPTEGTVYIEENGGRSYRLFLANTPRASDFAEVTVPAHHCFVLGDNRYASLDSRHFGPIPYAVIEGRADYIYWPADTWSRFGRLR